MIQRTLLLFLAFILPAVVFAQGPVLDPSTTPDIAALFSQAFEAVAHGDYWLPAGIVVSLLTWGFRSHLFNRIPGPIGIWLTAHPMVGLATPFALSGLLGVATAIANKSGVPVTAFSLVMSVLKVGATAVAAFIAAKQASEASVLGAIARGEVATPAAASALLVAGPKVVAITPAATPTVTEQLLEVAADKLKGAAAAAVAAPPVELPKP